MLGIGSYGSNYKSGVFRNSGSGTKEEFQTLGKVSYFIAGNEAFNCSLGFNTLFAGECTPGDQIICNHLLSRARRVIENALYSVPDTHFEIKGPTRSCTK